MEKIYTIPVNEQFEKTDGCPFCRMKEMLEANEIELILGASMMEPDTRIKTNEQGFCAKHFGDMYRAQKRLPLALMLESHLDRIQHEIKTPKISLKDKMATVSEKSGAFCETCYVCGKVEFHLAKMFETACLLWDADAEFRRKFAAQTSFCLPCYTRMLKTAKNFVSKKKQGDFLEAAQNVETAYLDKLKDDVSWFCKKFDYRYKKEDWGDAKDSVERAVRFLCGNSALEQKKEKAGNGEE